LRNILRLGLSVLRNNKKTTLILSLQIISLVLGLLSVLALKGSAQASTSLIPGAKTTCANSSSSYYDSLNQPISGSIYVRLPAGSSPTVIYLYSETASNSSCQLIGGAKAEVGHWTFIANSSGLSNLMIQGQGLNSEPHSVVAELLAVPTASICTPIVVCDTTYAGISGSLQPNLISDTTDRVAVYVANTVADIKYTNINYYADGAFLYSSTQLRPVNQDFLPGGTHAIFIQLVFVNGEKININQSVDMGMDWSGLLRVRSNFYRSHNKFLFASVIVITIALAIVALWLARIIHKRHEFRIDRGTDESEEVDMLNPSDHSDNIKP